MVRSTTTRPSAVTSRPLTAASGCTANPAAQTVTSAGTERPSAAIATPGSTAAIAVCSWTAMPNRAKDARRWRRAFGDSHAPSSPRAASATFRSGRASAISAAVSIPVSPSPTTNTLPPGPSSASRSRRRSAADRPVTSKAYSATPGTPCRSTALPSAYSRVS